MSLHSAEDYDSSTSTPVFGGTVSQTKLQQQQQQHPTNDLAGQEKLSTPKLAVNGENETTNGKTTDSAQPVNGNDSAVDTHLNGRTVDSTVDQVSTTQDNVPTSDPVGKDKDPEALPAAPEPALSSSADVAQDNVTSASAPVADNAPSVDAPAAPTSTSSNENVPASATAPEATVLAELSQPEPKTRAPRGKAKAPTVTTPPTRQSTRARKPVTTTPDADDSTDEAELQAVQTTTPKRGKRQTKEAPNPSSSTAMDTANEEAVAHPPGVEETKSFKTPSPAKGGSAGKKRGASTSPAAATSKKTKTTPKGKQSTPTNDEPTTEESSVLTATEPVQTPPAKKARTSANRKTPTTTTTTPEATGDYGRKLRPRK